jgi:hypothetical protein
VYRIDSLINLVGMSAGGSIDWTMGDSDIKYSFGFELRDTGEHGFLLPEDQGRRHSTFVPPFLQINFAFAMATLFAKNVLL